MNLWLFRMAWRDSRRQRGRLALYTCAISVGIAALVAIQSLSKSLENEVELQASALLGADLQISSNQSFSDSLRTYLFAIEAQHSEQIQLTSMIYLPQSKNSRLAQVRAVSGSFPFYGKLETYPVSAAETFRDGARALIDDNIMLQFSVNIGDSIKVGNQLYRVEGKLLKIPGETSLRSDIQPRIYIPKTYLDSTYLLQRGSRVDYSMFLKLDSKNDVEKITNSIQELFKDEESSLTITTVEDRKRQIGRSLTNLNRFLNLGAFIALLLGAVGVASAVHAYISQKLDNVAILRSLGATLKQTFTIYLIQAAAIGTWGSIIGGLLGIAGIYFLPLLIGDVLPFNVQTEISFRPMIQGMAIGLALALLFASRPLLAIGQTPPLRTLRAAYETNRTYKIRLYNFVANFSLIVATLLFAVEITGRLDYGAGFTVGIIIAFAALAGVGYLLTWGARRFFPSNWRYEWRQGLANLFRPNNQTIMLLLGLGLGTFLISTLYITQNTIVNQIEGVGSDNQPNAVLFDIQSDQIDGLISIFAELKLPIIQQVPIVTMRLHSVNGISTSELRESRKIEGRRRGNWALTREYRCTYRDTLNHSEKLISGEWSGTVRENTTYVSLERRIASNLNVTVGDSLVFDVQGFLVPVLVGSIREVDWQRIMPNFFVIFPNGVLEAAPQFHVIVTRYEKNERLAELQRKSIGEYPNVSIIDLDLVLSTVDTILTKVSFVIRFLAMFSLATGMIVLVGIIVGSRYQRMRESALLRTIGATRAQVGRIMFLEYVFLGVFSSLTGLTLSIFSSWSLSYFIFDVPFRPNIFLLFMALPIIATLTSIVGHLTASGTRSIPPLEILRNIG